MNAISEGEMKYGGSSSLSPEPPSWSLELGNNDTSIGGSTPSIGIHRVLLILRIYRVIFNTDAVHIPLQLILDFKARMHDNPSTQNTFNYSSFTTGPPKYH